MGDMPLRVLEAGGNAINAVTGVVKDTLQAAASDATQQITGVRPSFSAQHRQDTKNMKSIQQELQRMQVNTKSSSFEGSRGGNGQEHASYFQTLVKKSSGVSSTSQDQSSKQAGFSELKQSGTKPSFLSSLPVFNKKKAAEGIKQKG